MQPWLLVNVRGGRGLYGNVAHINLVQHHAKAVNIAYIYDIRIIHSYRDILIGLWIESDWAYSFIYSFIIGNTVQK